MRANQIVQLLDAVDRQLASRGVVSELASGAAFEIWLAVETRLCFECIRGELGVSNSLWTANEYPAKIDLSINDGTNVEVALEFKLIYNNKNWRSQVTAAHGELSPLPGTPKAEWTAHSSRWAVVGLIGKVYQPGYGEGYAGPVRNIGTWERDVLAALSPPGGGIQQAWAGRRHPVNHRWLDPQTLNFFQLYGLTT